MARATDLGEMTVDQLQSRARRAGIEGRSKMNKAQLVRALRRRSGTAGPKRTTTKRSSAKTARSRAAKKAATTRKRRSAARKRPATKRTATRKTTDRSKAAKKASATRKRTAAKRSAAGKKAAATRKRTTARPAAKKTMAAKPRSASTAQSGIDAITLLKTDHQNVDGLFRTFEATGDQSERRRIADRVIRELSVHASIEEQIFYPAVRRTLPNGDTLVGESLHEHQEVKEALVRLERLNAADPAFQSAMTELIRDVRHHVQEEETQILPRLRQSMDRQQLEEIGGRMQRAKGLAPTRPHPNAPSTPPGNVVAGVAAKAYDRAKETITDLMGS
jgi:hemerythrin superfamily protein